MAIANNSVITGMLKGSLGKQIVFRNWEGKTIVAKSPKERSGNPTPAQADHQTRFQLASRYAKSIMSGANQSLADGYRSALSPRQNVYTRALEDFMTLPEVTSIDCRQYTGAAGDKITIRAFDDFRVKSVKVEVFAPDDSLLESGNAVAADNGLDWIYTASQLNNPLSGSKVRATATDVPGNEHSIEVTL